MLKTGIVFEGGASRACFSCGVMDALLEEQVAADYIIGVSAGIAYGVSFASGQKGRNLEIIQKYVSDKRYMGLGHLLNKENRSLYNIDFSFAEIPQNLVPFDYEAFAAYKGEVIAVATNIHSGKAEYFHVPRDETSMDYLVASCSLPVAFQPVKIGRHYYLDGGLSDSIPYKKALADGCDKVIVVLTREHGYYKTSSHANRLITKMYHNYPQVVKALEGRADDYNACRQQLFELQKRGDVFVIEPETMLDVKRTERDTEVLTDLYEEGYRIAQDKMEALHAYLKAGARG